jgi:DNA polymerase-3 subunit epsilon/ATP-dependent DNA helicase DinG
LLPTFVTIDLETTGLDASRDAIIEIAALRFDAGGVLEEWQSLVRPEQDLPARVRQLTGLAPEDLEDAPLLAEILPELRDFIGESPLVGHSIHHDLKFLTRRGLRFPQPTIDTFELATVLVPEAERYSLARLSELFGIDGVQTTVHRALADAHAHRLLFLALYERARSLPADLLITILRMTEGKDWPPSILLRAALAAGPPDPVSRDERNGHGEVPIPAETDRTSPPIGPAIDAAGMPDIDTLEALIAAGGKLSEQMPGFEDRPGQRAMLRAVAETLERGDHLLVEAGTGTGKGLAYLLPAAVQARERGRPVVLATHTIALQSQLVAQDLPLAEALLGRPIRWALLKGRANYLCRSRLQEMTARDDLDVDALRALAKILIWERITQTGDRAELLLQPEERQTWQRVSAEAGCFGERCAGAGDGGCWLHRARAAAASAELIVTNHALLATEMRAEQRILPAFDQLIIDEAHQLESVATDALSTQLGRPELEAALVELHGPDGPLAEVARQLGLSGHGTGLSHEPKLAAELGPRIAALRAEAEACIGPVKAFFVSVEACFIEQVGKGGREARLTEALRSQAGWMLAEAEWDALRDRLLALGRSLDGLAPGLREAGLKPPGGLARAGLNLLALVDKGERIVLDRGRGRVTWIGRRGPGRVSLHGAPLDVGLDLADSLFEGRAVVLCSATLRAGDDFEFARDRLCLPEAPALAVSSGFDYERAALICAPRDIPSPDQAEYQRMLDRTIEGLALALGGRCLVLYTSYQGLKQTYHSIRNRLGQAGIAVIAQGIDGTRHQLLTAFKDPEAPTVLLGTRSFWEGIDVPGPALSALVIARLPFEVPSDPVLQARSETFDDPFREYSVPQGVLRFRQGFGRLIRGAGDRGVVVIMDSRVHTKSYGPMFLDALPPCPRFEGAASEVPAAASRFLSEASAASE